MDNSRFSKIIHIADPAICSVWLLLVAHEELGGRMINPFILLFPALRIWSYFLMKRQSKLMIAPIAVLVLLASCMFLDTSLRYLLFVGPWETLLTSICALFSMSSVRRVELHELVGDVCKNILSIVGYLWLVIYPLAVYIYKRTQKQLAPGTMGVWKYIGMCIYIFGCTIASSIILSVSYKTTIAILVLVFMLMLIPIIFYRGSVKNLFSRSEVAYLLTIALFAIGYVCGIGLELKSVVTVCLLPAAFYALANWYVRRETTYRDILLVVGASIVFWCAQYTTNMVRVLLLLVSLALVAVTVVRFAIDTKRHWTSVGIFLVVAFVMPVFCLGYNPYSVLEAGRAWHFDKYYGSRDGILCVRAGNTGGLRDRYGVILPLEYDRIELLTPSKPYCKVRKDSKWQIYDIERQELVSDEWFEDVIRYGEYTYLLKSGNEHKYLIMPKYYSRFGGEQPAVIEATNFSLEIDSER